jgi:hypothetical protein
MRSIRLSAQTSYRVLVQGVLCLAVSLPLAAQVQTKTTTTQGAVTRRVTIQRGEIAYVRGRTVVVKMEDGTLEEFDNVPNDLTFTVDGKPVNIRNAQVGMKLEKQTVTTTQPQLITTVETVTGRVWRVMPPHSVILTLENGENQAFKIPEGQKFMVDGKETDAWGLRKGMIISAQKVIETPVTVATQEVRRTGTAPASIMPAPTLKQDVPLLVIVAPRSPQPPAETAQVESTPAKLPTTASDVPLLGLLGVLFCTFALILKAIRSFAAHS